MLVRLKRYADNMKAIVDHCQKANINVTLFTASTGGCRRQSTGQASRAQSDNVRGLAREPCCVLIGLRPAQVDALRRPTPYLLTCDRVKMTPEGYQLNTRTCVCGHQRR
jgi:hypothetical protein